jgi:hypothetical protein
VGDLSELSHRGNAQEVDDGDRLAHKITFHHLGTSCRRSGIVSVYLEGPKVNLG